jgi:hypothetical protein
VGKDKRVEETLFADRKCRYHESRASWEDKNRDFGFAGFLLFAGLVARGGRTAYNESL